MQLRSLLVVASVALLAFAPAPLAKRERKREDLTDVAGTWTFVLWENNGVRRKSSEERFLVEMTRDRFALLEKNGEPLEIFAMRLEPGTSPPAFAWSMMDKTVFVGSYRFQKDEVMMILRSGSRLEDRPTDFQGPCLHRFVLRRLTR